MNDFKQAGLSFVFRQYCRLERFHDGWCRLLQGHVAVDPLFGVGTHVTTRSFEPHALEAVFR
jgi:hypothetical protein